MNDDLLEDDADAAEGTQELFEHHRFTVDGGQALLRIDKYLLNKIQNASRTKIQNAAEAGNILVDGKPVKSNYRIKPHQLVQILLPHPRREIELIPENIPINIVYEDDDLIVVNKQPGLVVHPGYGNYTGTLVNALLYHYSQLPAAKDGNELRPGLVHRIDKNTSGLMVMAKSEYALAHLGKQFFDRAIDRLYTALVWGDLKEDEGTIEGNIGRSIRERKHMDVFPEGDHGKPAITRWKVLERLGYVTLVQCKLETGRTHQIRVHMKYIGHPLFNDPEYGGNRILKGTTFAKYKQFVENCFAILPRQALHARTLGFIHPATKKRMQFDSELPDDMKQVLEKWRRYMENREREDS